MLVNWGGMGYNKRLPFGKFEPILSELDKAGYYSLECWGGATFDSCLRYLDEDPFISRPTFT